MIRIRTIDNGEHILTPEDGEEMDASKFTGMLNDAGKDPDNESKYIGLGHPGRMTYIAIDKIVTIEDMGQDQEADT